MKLTKAKATKKVINKGQYIIYVPVYSSLEDLLIDFPPDVLVDLVNKKLFDMKRACAMSEINNWTPKPKVGSILIDNFRALIFLERRGRQPTLASVSRELKKEKNAERRTELLKLAQELLKLEASRKIED